MIAASCDITVYNQSNDQSLTLVITAEGNMKISKIGEGPYIGSEKLGPYGMPAHISVDRDFMPLSING